MKEFIFLLFMGMGVFSMGAQCDEEAENLKAVIQYGYQLDMRFNYFPPQCFPCGPPGFVDYFIEVETGTMTSSGIVWGNRTAFTLTALSNEVLLETSANIGQRQSYARFRVRVDDNSSTCDNPWTPWREAAS